MLLTVIRIYWFLFGSLVFCR